MPREPRSFQSGEIYHIVQRGINKSYIFEEQFDKANFFEILENVKEKYPFTLLFYTIMDNHYHLIIKMQKINLSKIISCINYRYSRYYNARYNKKGSNFGARFSASKITGKKHLLVTINYLVYNPVKAKIVSKPSHYKWSTHTDIISNQKSFADLKTLLKIINSDEKKAKQNYINFICTNENMSNYI